MLLVAIAGSAAAQPPIIPNAPPGISGDVCETFTYDFDYMDPEGGIGYIFKASGPGEVDSVTGVWTYTPVLADVGVAQILEVYAKSISGLTGPPIAVEIVVNNDPPQFTNCPVEPITVVWGYPRTLQLQTTGACAEDGSLYRLLLTNPNGATTIDSTTGLLTLIVNDTYGWADVEVSDGNGTDICEIEVAVIGSSCEGGQAGDLNHDESIDLTDLILLVNRLFVGASPSFTVVRANIDGDHNCQVDLSDLIHFVNYLFLGGPPPADCILDCEFVDW